MHDLQNTPTTTATTPTGAAQDSSGNVCDSAVTYTQILNGIELSTASLTLRDRLRGGARPPTNQRDAKVGESIALIGSLVQLRPAAVLPKDVPPRHSPASQSQRLMLHCASHEPSPSQFSRQPVLQRGASQAQNTFWPTDVKKSSGMVGAPRNTSSLK